MSADVIIPASLLLIASAFNTLVRMEGETAYRLQQYTAMHNETALHHQQFMALQHEFVSTKQQGE